jgi:GNAT superfamily N-acetyltransferase
MAASEAITLRHRTSARHAPVINLLTARGFQIVSRAQDWRLDPCAASSCAAPVPPDARWEFTSIEELWRNPPLFDAALELLTEASEDNPSDRPFLPIHPDMLRRGLQMQRDGVLAIIDGTLHGLLTSSRDDAIAGGLRLNCVVVRKSRRREGIATAMLARLLPVRGVVPARLVAPTAPELAAWLTRRGFVQVADSLVLERIMRRTVRVAPRLLDEYVGRYIAEMPLGATILIERHGASLISKTRDMRDLLLAASDSEFFARHHYGRGRFERDESGRVTRLVCIEGSREFVANRQ